VHRVTIQYATPTDIEAFETHYFEKHVPLVAPVPGLRSFTWSKSLPMGGERTVYMVAQLDFDDATALNTAVTSPEMAAAGADAASMGVPMTMFSGEVVNAQV